MSKLKPPSDTLTTAEFAAIAGVSVSTITRWNNAKRLPIKPVQESPMRWDVAHVQAWIDGGKVAQIAKKGRL